MPSSVDNEYAALSAVYGPGLSIQDMRLRKYGGPTVPAKSVADLEYMYWGPSTTLSNADKKLAYLQNQTGKTGQSIDDLTSLSIGSATVTARNIVDRPAPVAVTNWSSNNVAMWACTYTSGTISVERLAGATGFVTASMLGTGIIAGSPNLPAGSQWQRSVEIFSTVQVTVTNLLAGGYPTGQVIPANVWTTIRNNFIGSGSAQFVMGFQLVAASDPGLGVLTQLRHAMLVEDKSTWLTNQITNPTPSTNAFWGSSNAGSWVHTYANNEISVDRQAGASANIAASIIRAGISTNPVLSPTINYQRSIEVWVDAAGTVQPTTGEGYVGGQVLAAGQWTRVVEQFYGKGVAEYPTFMVVNIPGVGTGIHVKIRRSQLIENPSRVTQPYSDPKDGLASWTGTVDASTSVVATKQIAYADGRSTGWSWEGAADASPSTGPVSYVLDNRVNLATNPGYESGTNSIQTGSVPTYPISADTVLPIGGNRSALITRAASGLSSTIGQFLGNIGAASVKIPVTEGQIITGGLSVKTDQANASINTRFYLYDAVSTQTQTTPKVPFTGVTAGQVYRVTDTFTVPAGIVSCYFAVTIATGSGNVVGGEKAWADYLTLEYGATDGSWF